MSFHHSKHLSPVAAFALVGLALGGCGLIDPDITEFDLSLPEKEFIIDTEQWGLSADGEFPSIDCEPSNDVCATALEAVCAAPECAGTGVCDEVTSTCKLVIQVSLSQSINLVNDKPELQTIENQPFIDVTIDNVEYEIVENTLDFATPDIQVYVAPQNIMSPDSGDARLVGTIESVPAMRQQDWTAMMLADQGESNLRQFMGDYRSIFNVIAGTTVELTAGTPMPSPGRAVARVRVDAHAGL